MRASLNRWEEILNQWHTDLIEVESQEIVEVFEDQDEQVQSQKEAVQELEPVFATDGHSKVHS